MGEVLSKFKAAKLSPFKRSIDLCVSTLSTDETTVYAIGDNTIPKYKSVCGLTISPTEFILSSPRGPLAAKLIAQKLSHRLGRLRKGLSSDYKYAGITYKQVRLTANRELIQVVFSIILSRSPCVLADYYK
jgi:hypothetical protein